MSTQPEALRLADALDLYATGDKHQKDIEDAAAELRRLFELAQEQHSVIYGLRLQVANLQHNNEVLTNAIWKACGDDEQAVNDTIESQGALR